MWSDKSAHLNAHADGEYPGNAGGCAVWPDARADGCVVPCRSTQHHARGCGVRRGCAHGRGPAVHGDARVHGLRSGAARRPGPSARRLSRIDRKSVV